MLNLKLKDYIRLRDSGSELGAGGGEVRFKARDYSRGIWFQGLARND